MDTKAELKALLPEISRRLSMLDHNIGDRESGYNDFAYDQDGWYITFVYDLSGKWERGYGFDSVRGRVTDLSIEHYDEEREEEDQFSDDEIFKFREDLEAMINNIF